MLANLPEISFAEARTANVEQNIIKTYESIADKKLYPGDPVRLFLGGLAYIIGQQRFIIDHAAKQNLLAYAEDDHLDHLGILTDTARLPAQPSKATVRFSVSEPLETAALIPQGTRVTPGNQIYFATIESVEIPAGETSATAIAECLETGAKGNGFLPGQINKIVDPVEHVDSAENTTTSLGGTDKESNENFRRRIRLSPEKYSSAGPNLGYEYWAREAHQDIIDVSVLSPDPGTVVVYVLMAGGLLPDETVLDAVSAEVNAEKRRPLSDHVIVSAPDQISYSVDLTYYINRADATRAAAIKDAVNKAVDGYVEWQKSAIGRDINPSELIRRVQEAGAKRVHISSPDSFRDLSPDQVANETAVNISYGGMEDV